MVTLLVWLSLISSPLFGMIPDGPRPVRQETRLLTSASVFFETWALRAEDRMAQPTLDQLMWAIGQQESGGNYSVVNSIGAVGKYQVMKANIPSWSRAALGYSISWQKFRDSPDLQEKIVRYKLNSYYKNYGFRGAASAWYSGNPKLDMSTRAQS